MRRDRRSEDFFLQLSRSHPAGVSGSETKSTASSRRARITARTLAAGRARLWGLGGVL